MVWESIQEVAGRAECDDDVLEQCAVKLREARDRIVVGQCSAFTGRQDADELVGLCLRLAGELRRSIDGMWRELLHFEDGQDLVWLILSFVHEPMVELLPNKEAEIDASYDQLGRALDSAGNAG